MTRDRYAVTQVYMWAVCQDIKTIGQNGTGHAKVSGSLKAALCHELL